MGALMRSSYRVFADRSAAGTALARHLQKLPLQAPILVLGLPRGGVPVAYEVACLLQAPLDVMLVRKIGVPGQPELAMGAVASGGIVVHEPRIAAQVPELAAAFDRVAKAEMREIERRERLYRAGLPPLDVRGRTVILVDDGLATGSTMLAAVRAARQGGATTVVAAAPVASAEATAMLETEANTVISLEIPAMMESIGASYEDFEQVSDVEVCGLLECGRTRRETIPQTGS